MFESVLVANRGEIAVRVIRTLRALGIRSVAVYSDADAGALHVRVADVALRLGPAPTRDSYLSIDRVLEAASTAGVDALHPGYGFLAENATFAQACTDAGVSFVGPPAAAIHLMGDKSRARRTVAAAGVPVVPGADEPDMTDDQLMVAADGIGYPLLIKPSAGGGGKGMQRVDDPGSLPRAVARARREAASAFGDDTLLLERFVTRPRHIEIQVLADAHGHVVHLGERECSLQRRHQKIIEESPSVFVDAATRTAMGAHAIAVAQACGYTNVGTVEFVVSSDDPNAYFFIEMNTRLQVEHAVTEAVTGLDLVEWQLRIASGEAFPWQEHEIAFTGHAFEGRVYAEDPGRDFLPTGGTVHRLREPHAPGVRVDSGLQVGDDISTHYDPMLAKVIAWAPDRETARRRLDRALAGTAVLGVPTNLGFLRRLLGDPAVVAGDLDTELTDRVAADPPPSPPPVMLAAAALVVLAASPPPSPPSAGPASAWDTTDGWRVGGSAWTTLRVGGSTVRLQADGPDWRVQVDDEAVAPASLATRPSGDEPTVVTYRGVTVAVDHHRDGDTLWIGADGDAWALTVEDAGSRWPTSGTADSYGPVGSPMPGSVVSVAVVVGEHVTAGSPLVTVEAMKMEHTVAARADAVVAAVHVRAGQQVARDEALVTLAAPDAPATDQGAPTDG